ncbi:FecR domain-containing protein [Hyphomicrobium sp. D-2]|uniref:FecR family protein n=1 Tax=Hyphomicrobium sp. D-2 TaxID=3041621 RepID=UPI002457E818|nr:FecR domain-containing protein [Hyphomicrobium sp. D-2]MDH4983704.1 FecR domain-containing protein [Hyphomicrobium sp. D-2]
MRPDDDQQPENEIRHSDPDIDAALDWFLQLQDAPNDQALRDAFEAWRASSPARRQAYDRIERLHGLPSLRDATVVDRQKLQGAHNAAKAARKSDRRWQPTLRGASLAAAAVLLLGVGLTRLPGALLWLEADHMTGVGQRSNVELPDGSQVTLNTSSAISLDFSQGRRGVTLLAGEAFFSVVPNASRPFVVTSNFSSVEVTGTAFLVRETDSEDVVVLEHGSVEVSDIGQQAAPVRLAPGQMIASTATHLGVPRSADLARSLAWLEGKMTFDGETFGTALDEMRRHYGGRVVVAAMRSPDVTVSGNYRIDDPEAAIRTLAASVGLNAVHIPGGILLLY